MKHIKIELKAIEIDWPRGVPYYEESWPESGFYSKGQPEQLQVKMKKYDSEWVTDPSKNRDTFYLIERESRNIIDDLLVIQKQASEEKIEKEIMERIMEHARVSYVSKDDIIRARLEVLGKRDHCLKILLGTSDYSNYIKGGSNGSERENFCQL